MYKIMIVEDNTSIRRELSLFFQQNGYETVAPSVCTQINNEIDCCHPDIILLDINLIETDGFQVCTEIRKTSDIPIVFVTGRDSVEDETKGIVLGGDDFIRKPYHLPVLLARIRRILDRHQKNNLLHVDGTYLDVLAMTLQTKDATIALSKTDCRILYYLFLNKGKVVTKDKLIEALWESKSYIDENILNVNISRLRKRLSGVGLGDFIRTVPHEGYIV